jgi:serine protease Do
MVGAAALLSLVGLRGNAKQESATPPVQPTAQVLNIQDDFEKVADKLRPSVVAIQSRETLTANPMLRQGKDQGDESPFGGFQFQAPNFPGFPGGGGGQQFRIPQQQFPRHAVASGSGVIVSGDGYILTNDHVVAGAEKVTVTLLDGREFVGQVKRDPKSDLALIKINADNLPAAQLANSDDVRIGQWALAFGSPFRLSDTMTVGVISSLHRHETIGDGGDTRYYPSLLQTDASINPGNSGGPLVDVYGRVIGINVAIESPTGGNVGIGFAIPANTAKYIMGQLMTKGSVTRGYLGMVPASLTYEDQQQYGVKQGALVTAVVDGSPAGEAGMKVQDVITSFDGKPVTNEADFRDMVARTAPGTSVPVTVRRDGGEQTLHVTVGKLPDEAAPAAPAPQQEQKSHTKLGISIGDVSDANVRQQLQQTGMKIDATSGAVIVDVAQGSPAMEAGLQPGDVVLRLNNKPITNAQQLSDVAASLPSGASVPVVVRRTVPVSSNKTESETVLVTVNLD